EAGYVLTGDARRYNNVNGAFDAPAIANVFDPSTGKWGAVELVARYSVTDLNDNAGAAGAATPVGGVRGGEQEIITAGVNWFVNPAVKFGLQYQDVSVERLNAAGAEIGQDYNTVALRSQFAF
ncbi:MAG: porin, partial [Brevundimonas sp.]